MFSFVIDSLLALPLLGGLLHFAYVYRGFDGRNLMSRLALGAAFGIAALVVMRAGLIMPDSGGSINAVAGVVLFAGYIGGLRVGLVTLAVMALCRMVHGPDMAHGGMALVGIGTQAAYLAAGLVMRRCVYAPRWPDPPLAALGWALGIMVVLHSAGILTAFAAGLVPDTAAALPRIALSYVVTGCSVILVWAVLRLSARLSGDIRMGDLRARQMSMLYDAAKVGACRYDRATGRMHLDRNLRRMYGLPPDQCDVAIQDWMEMQHPDDRDGLLATIEKLRGSDGTPVAHVSRLYRADGEVIHVKRIWQCAAPDGPYAGLDIGLHIDVTDVEQLAADRDTLLQRLNIAAQNFPGMIYQGIWSTTRVVQHLYLSDKCVDYWGVTPQQAYDDPAILDHDKPQEEIEKAARLMLENVATGKPIHNRARTPNAWIDFYGNATDLEDGTYRIDGVVLDVTAEVTALQEADRQSDMAEKAQRLESIGKLTGGIAHDFNNLLAVIMGNLELLRDRHPSSEDQQLIGDAITASQRGAQLTGSMLSFARRARLVPKPHDLNAVISEARSWMQRALPQTVVLNTDTAPDLWRAKLDAGSFENALLNLLLNASDAMDGHGTLTLATRNLVVDEDDAELPPGRYVELAVTDTGSGIDAATLPHIFDPFFSTKGPGKGSGLGLSMVEGFAKQSGGTVRVTSTPGKGTTFRLVFPASTKPASRHTTPSTASGPEGADQHILLVEDDPAVRKVLSTTLAAAGYRVSEAADGAHAMTVFDAGAGIDVVVTDMVMPGPLQGEALAEKLRQKQPDLPVVLLTGFAEPHEDGPPALSAPNIIRMQKPVARADLLRAISSVLTATSAKEQALS